jgi:hypothetical protein
MHGELAASAGLLQVAAEAGRAAGGQVVHADLLERPAGARNVWMYRAISPVPKNPARTGRSRSWLSALAAAAASAAVRVALMIELSRQANG